MVILFFIIGMLVSSCVKNPHGIKALRERIVKSNENQREKLTEELYI